MFAFSRKGKKLGRVKVQLSDSTQGTRSPVRQTKRVNNSHGDGVTTVTNDSDDNRCSSTTPELDNSTSGNSEGWKKLPTSGDKPTPRFNHAAAVIGKKMIIVGGESGNGLLEDVQVLNFENFTWTTASSRLYLSPSSLTLKIPACKGHCLVPWGKKVLLVGGRTALQSDRVSVWAFDAETECWSLMEAKGDIPVARSGHTVVRAGSALILFGGEDIKRKKLNDLHMFDLKSLTWLPLHCTGPGPSARSNHVAALYDDKLLLVFGGTSKSKSLNDLYSLDFETMMWSRIKIRGFHPSPRAGCCGVLCGTKWYIAGGGSRKKRHPEVLAFDILKREWSVVLASSQQSMTTNKGFSLVLLQKKDTEYLVAFGGLKKEPSDQVEVLMMEKNESSMSRRSAPSEKRTSSTGPAMLSAAVGSLGRQNLASAIEHHGSGRKSLSESLLVDSNVGNVSLRKEHVDEDMALKLARSFEDERSSLPMEQTRKQSDTSTQTSIGGGRTNAEETLSMVEHENTDKEEKERNVNLHPSNDDTIPFQETDGKSGFFPASSSIYQLYEIKMSALVRKNGILEGQLAAALAGREAAEKNLSSVLKSRQEVEKRLADTLKDMELMKEKLVLVEMAQEEANSLSNIVHTDHVRLEHDVAFLKAVLDDTQKELHSTRGVLSGERARAFQLQVEVFHLKQRLQSMENRTPTPRKPFHG